MKGRRITLGLLAIGLLLLWLPAAFAAPQDKDIDPETAKALAAVPRITVQEVKNLIDKKADVVIVDTRDSSSYDFGHIKGAVNIYYNPAGDPADREMTLVALPMDKPILIYCACQNEEESAPMALELYKLGYDHDKVKAIRGGSIKWEEMKYPYVATVEGGK